ncbi:carbamoyltransferase C-terminal domain-containing protein [Sphaerimonospora mesophila]|uniref:carbamoyltransferase family protein n=1 Tax=Sphaerimonospora mesophila TaxID=37483 RepID=UPI0006E34017
MLVLGICGLFGTEDDEFLPGVKRSFHHDAAACLLEDDRVVLAVEEERLNRVKHTNLFPARAVRACLDARGATLGDLDAIAYFWDENHLDVELDLHYLRHPSLAATRSRDLIANRLELALGQSCQHNVIEFHRHHDSHAASVFHDSGFDEALVLVMDGNGEDKSCSVYAADAQGLNLLRTTPAVQSLGHYYTGATQLIGYGSFDEYKMMGLAPYGDPGQFAKTLDELLELRENGEFSLDAHRLQEHLLLAGYQPRKAGEPFEDIHMNLSAAVQDQLERAVFHMLQYWASQGFANLCLAGGVAHNSTLNGKILQSGLFRHVFVHPASHDSGAAVGAALLSTTNSAKHGRRSLRGADRIRSVFWGPEIEVQDEAEAILHRWNDLVTWERCSDSATVAATMIADGSVIAWATGASEFGPRALGHRSILADPRPASNKDRVNSLIKMREGYRPFAPAVLAERVHEYFDLPATDTTYDFMGFVATVRESSRAALGAVTHVDGTARLQTVDKAVNPRFWKLIHEFAQITGVPVVLNTSLNNNAEPIVQSLEDCLATLLTTGLDALVLDGHIVRRRRVEAESILTNQVMLPPLVQLTSTVTTGTGGPASTTTIGFRDWPSSRVPITSAVSDLLTGAADAVQFNGSERHQVAQDLWDLWQRRLIRVRPYGPQSGMA